ncbi:MAG TPA: HAMP domain-containing sensor histidine kinase, partial [Thermoanaerobaculia bacterium]
ADPRSVRVKVADTGPGIPPERVAAIFEPFVSTKLHRGGTGLGLSISHDIVERHGGSLVVASNSREGACFSVELPRHRAHKTA